MRGLIKINAMVCCLNPSLSQFTPIPQLSHLLNYEEANMNMACEQEAFETEDETAPDMNIIV